MSINSMGREGYGYIMECDAYPDTYSRTGDKIGSALP
jgi:hypothetical protein